ncbi:hypothetical protein [Spiroplasma sp. DGKH1]|uniref:hypothetical protein n=1 Tax=Spiroplasma sp. DGKH1 TaxID=3050074 RepID=UPI0034C6CC61
MSNSKTKGKKGPNNNLGLNRTQLELLKKRELTDPKELFPNREIKGYRSEEQDSAPKAVAKAKNNPFNSDILGLSATQKTLLDKRNTSPAELWKNNTINNVEKEEPVVINSPSELGLNATQKKLLSQRDVQRGPNNDDLILADEIIETNEENKLQLFNEKVKENSRTWGLNKTQLELLKRRNSKESGANLYNNAPREGYRPENDLTKVQNTKPKSIEEIRDQLNLSKSQLNLLSKRNSNAGEWKKYMDSVAKKQAINKPKPRKNPDHILQHRKRLKNSVQEWGLGRKVNVGDKVIKNYIPDEQPVVKLLSTEFFLPTDITSQINPLAQSAKVVEPKTPPQPKPSSRPVVVKPAPIVNDEQPEPVKKTKPKRKKVLKEEIYISDIDPKKRPNLKKLKYGENFFNLSEENEKKASAKIDTKLQNKKQTVAEEKLILQSRKKLKDYGINYYDESKRPNLEFDLTAIKYTTAGYHPNELKAIERRRASILAEKQYKEKLISKNIKKEQKLQKKLSRKHKKPPVDHPLPQILVAKYENKNQD